jgi:hypothetical protein
MPDLARYFLAIRADRVSEAKISLIRRQIV